MKTIGLLGGMSAESTVIYYTELNRLVRERLGGLHSAKLVLWSVDFAPIAELQAKGEWEAMAEMLGEAAGKLVAAGAEAILICTNTMHVLAPRIEAAAGAPVIHIADATAAALKAHAVKRPLLLATRFTMEKAFYRDRLAAAGLDAMVPGEGERQRLHAIIYDELCQGVISPASKDEVLAMIRRGKAAGADGVIFGCTEIGLLIDPAELDLPAVDTAIVHCRAAADFALANL